MNARTSGLIAGVLMLAMLTSACLGDDTEVAEDPVRVPNVTPTAIADLPSGIEVAEVAVVDGSFSVEEIILQRGEPTILEVDNQDDRPYRLQIGDLLTMTEIPAETTTQVEFTTPVPERYEGELIAADADEVLDTVIVIVRDEGATEP